MNVKCSIRGLIRKEGLVLNKIRVPCRGNLLKRSSTSIVLRTMVSTLLKTTTLKSVNLRFPSASPGCGNTSDVGLLRRMNKLLRRGKCIVRGVSTAVVTRHPGVHPRVSRVQRGVTGTLGVSISRVGMGTAARRNLNFAKDNRKVSSRTVYTVRGFAGCDDISIVRGPTKYNKYYTKGWSRSSGTKSVETLRGGRLIKANVFEERSKVY